MRLAETEHNGDLSPLEMAYNKWLDELPDERFEWKDLSWSSRVTWGELYFDYEKMELDVREEGKMGVNLLRNTAVSALKLLPERVVSGWTVVGQSIKGEYLLPK